MYVCNCYVDVQSTHVFTDLVNVSLLMKYLGTMLTTTIIQPENDFMWSFSSWKINKSICDCYLIFACLLERFVEARMRLHTGTRHYGRWPVHGSKARLWTLLAICQPALLDATLLSAVTMAPFGGLSWSANADLVRQTSGFTLSLQPSPFIRTWDQSKVKHIYLTSGLGCLSGGGYAIAGVLTDLMPFLTSTLPIYPGLGLSCLH